MISFVWEFGLPLPAGTGGSENYTIGHVRELNRRGIAAQVVTVGAGFADGRADSPGIPFRSLDSVAEVGQLDGTVVFVTEFPAVATRRPAYQFLHIPPPLREGERRRVAAQTRGRTLIATSRFGAELWSTFLGVDSAAVRVVYPFAEPCFGAQPRPSVDPAAISVLFAGRLSPEKGIYTFLAMLHNDLIVASDLDLTFTATTAGADKAQGRIIHQLVQAHPGVRVVSARKTPEAMAALMADHDIVVMPSNGQYWHETFGIVSIEAQHSGCRVVASNDGGLPETDCGAVTYVDPDNAEALAIGIRTAIAEGQMSSAERRVASAAFTVEQSIDGLLAVFEESRAPAPALIPTSMH
ncbi:MAG TPA: glycosyltransferase family 4 protein [Aeromicrobium sp.]|nr:glycosyltransferase family 4 protein [Aeromicrobium sp.]HKY56562.1 glycosyltransferase family 4 protein [Aeromicrobium sp.]